MAEATMAEVNEIVELTKDQGVIKEILTTGPDDAPCPQVGQEVLVNYEGKFENGTVFDTTFDKEPIRVTVGNGSVMKGWDIGLLSMKLDEKAELTIKPEYGYGNEGSPPPIPDGSTLTYTIELLSIDERRPTRWMMSDDEMIATAERKKAEGNEKFKEKDYKEAENLYR